LKTVCISDILLMRGDLLRGWNIMGVKEVIFVEGPVTFNQEGRVWAGI